MKQIVLEVGDVAWIYMSGHKGDLTKGFIVHKFCLNRNSGEKYVIEIDTPVDPVYEVRDGFTVSDTKKGPIGMYRKS